MIIKKKSLAVVLLSGLIISSVLVFTLIGYVIYIGLKDEESKRMYQDSLKRVNARIHSGNIDKRGAAR